MQNYNKLISGVTRFDELYGRINDMFDAGRSQFSGAEFPGNPTVGQPCYRVDMSPPQWFIFDGQTWSDPFVASTAMSAVTREVQDARGSAATLEARLDVAMNQDGTLKTNTPVGGWWTPEPDPVERLSDNQFTILGDRRQVYAKRRAVMLEQDDDAVSWVFAVAYQGGATIVTLSDPVVQPSLTGVSFGQEVGNEPGMQGFRVVPVEVTDPGGVKEVSLSELGFPTMSGAWYPLLQVYGPKPYTATVRPILPDSFTIRLFRPDGTPGADVSSGKAETGIGLQCGDAVFCGQVVPIIGVIVGCFIPLQSSLF
jgi:hypothetical protein